MSFSITCIFLAAAAILPAHHLPENESMSVETSLTAVSNEVLSCETDCGQHPAPEVVLTFCGACRGGSCDSGQNPWSLSSLDMPPGWPSIPLRPIKVEVAIPAGPVKFVELFLDNRPLAPDAYSTESPLTYQLPCPAQAGMSCRPDIWRQTRRPGADFLSRYDSRFAFRNVLKSLPSLTGDVTQRSRSEAVQP